MIQCRRCGREVVQKPPLRLVLVGVAMIAVMGLVFWWPILASKIGIPMLFVTVPTMLLALVPIALAEGCVFCHFCNLSPRDACLGALKANFWSTLLGIPMAWFFLVVLQLVTGG